MYHNTVSVKTLPTFLLRLCVVVRSLVCVYIKTKMPMSQISPLCRIGFMYAARQIHSNGNAMRRSYILLSSLNNITFEMNNVVVAQLASSGHVVVY